MRTIKHFIHVYIMNSKVIQWLLMFICCSNYHGADNILACVERLVLFFSGFFIWVALMSAFLSSNDLFCFYFCSWTAFSNRFPQKVYFNPTGSVPCQLPIFLYYQKQLWLLQVFNLYLKPVALLSVICIHSVRSVLSQCC